MFMVSQSGFLRLFQPAALLTHAGGRVPARGSSSLAARALKTSFVLQVSHVPSRLPFQAAFRSLSYNLLAHSIITSIDRLKLQAIDELKSKISESKKILANLEADLEKLTRDNGLKAHRTRRPSVTDDELKPHILEVVARMGLRV